MKTYQLLPHAKVAGISLSSLFLKRSLMGNGTWFCMILSMQYLAAGVQGPLIFRLQSVHRKWPIYRLLMLKTSYLSYRVSSRVYLGVIKVIKVQFIGNIYDVYVDHPNKDLPALLGFATNKGLTIAQLSKDFRQISILKVYAPQYCVYNSLPIRKAGEQGMTERVLLGIWQEDFLIVYNLKTERIEAQIHNPTKSDCPYMLQKLTESLYMLSDTSGINIINLETMKMDQVIDLPNTKRGSLVRVSESEVQIFTNTRNFQDQCSMVIYTQDV